MKIVVSENTANSESLIRQAFTVCAENLEQMCSECVHLPEVEYFIKSIRNSYDPEKITAKKPKIIVYGTNFPPEITHSLTGTCATTILGGSRVYIDASDESVPRDTDPVTRAALGQLYAVEPYWKDGALVVIPCSSDAQRKAAYLLSDRGWKVVTVWMPAVKDERTHAAFYSETEHAVSAICRHVHRRYSASALNRSVRYFDTIRASIRDFLLAALAHENKLPGPLRMAVMDSFFLTDNMDEWHENLKKLTDALNHEASETTNRPRVLLIGSPIYVPNGKIPQLLYASGLEICATIDARGSQTKRMTDEKKRISLKTLAAQYFDNDSSPAFVSNEQLFAATEDSIRSTHPDGIIWHVLKGQIEYDFELNRTEKLFEAHDLPVIRLETDYQYQDIEQLRIRIEAFAELLGQKKLEKGE